MNEKDERSFMEVDEENLIVTLDDGSQWTIRVGDITKVVCWTPTSPIVVEECKQEGFSHTLTNLGTGGPDVVLASRFL